MLFSKKHLNSMHRIIGTPATDDRHQTRLNTSVAGIPTETAPRLGLRPWFPDGSQVTGPAAVPPPQARSGYPADPTKAGKPQADSAQNTHSGAKPDYVVRIGTHSPQTVC